jgi:hypothetical protein
MHPTITLWRKLHLNTKLRNQGVRPGSYWVSPRAVSWVWGCRPPSLVVLSSISRRLFREPCMLRGHLAKSFPPILHPSPPIFKPFFHLYFHHKTKQNKTKETLYRRRASSAPALLDSLSSPASGTGLLTASTWWADPAPSRLPSLHYSFLPTQPACCPSSPLSPFLCWWYCESKIAIPQHNLDVDASAFDDFCPTFISGGGVRSRLVRDLSPPTRWPPSIQGSWNRRREMDESTTRLGGLQPHTQLTALGLTQ